MEPSGTGWWGPYRIFVQKALLRYSQLAGISLSVSKGIRNSKENTTSGMGVIEYNNAIDLYRAHMPDAQYTWGSNMTRSGCGINALDFNHYGLDSSLSLKYFEMAEGYLHWLHGVNPKGIVMLTNMYEYVADSSANEMHHYWFWDGTIYDNAVISPWGPAPGYVTGGPNREFFISTLLPPYNQPPQKAYKDWNTAWNGTLHERSYEITEPAIYYQGFYIQLLAVIIDNGKNGCSWGVLPSEILEFKGSANFKKATLQWRPIRNLKVALQRSVENMDFSTIASFDNLQNEDPVLYNDNNLQNVRWLYRMKFRNSLNRDTYSNTINVKIGGGDAHYIQKDPSSNILFLKSAINGEAMVNIFTGMGQLLQSSEIIFLSDETYQVQTRNLPHGSYWVEVSNTTQKIVKRFTL